MRFWPFSKRPEPERKHSAVGPNVARLVIGSPVWTPREYDRLAEESYQRNAVAFRGVKLVASAAAALPVLLYDRRGKEIEKHPLLDLLSRPAPGVSGAAFLESVYAYFLLAGNSYVERVGPERGPPKELYAHRPDRMQVIPGARALPMAYRYTVNGMPYDFPVEQVSGDGPILHLRDFNPLNDWYGMSRIEAAAYGIDRHNSASAHNKALLDNGARPSGALVFKPVKVGADEYAAPSQKMVDKAQERLTETHVGPENAGKPLVFTGDMDWLAMGTTPRDMDFNAGKADAARDILAALGVPHILLVPGESTFANRAEANLELHEQTVIPLGEMLVSALNGWLVPRFGDGLRLGVDLDGVSALEPRREGRRKSVVELFDRGVIDAAEARDALQYGERGPDFVEKPDAGVLAGLASQEVTTGPAGHEPLFRYLRKTGLLDPNTTLADFDARAEEAEAAAEEAEQEAIRALGEQAAPLQIEAEEEAANDD